MQKIKKDEPMIECCSVDCPGGKWFHAACVDIAPDKLPTQGQNAFQNNIKNHCYEFPAKGPAYKSQYVVIFVPEEFNCKYVHILFRICRFNAFKHFHETC